MSSKKFVKVEHNSNVKPQLSKQISSNKTNKSNGLYSKLRAIREGDSEAVITYHFVEKKTHNDYGGDANPKNTKFSVVEEKGREWKQISTINKECFTDHKGKNIPLDDVLALFVESCTDRGASHFDI